MIDLRSDTITLPTEAMRRAMAEAELGDDMFGDDPTVNRLEALAAERFGKEAAVLVTSGIQGNLTCLMALGRPGDELLLDADAHIHYYEAGAYASIAGLSPKLIAARDGVMHPDDLAAAIRPRDQHFPRPRILALENTHNRHGGKVMPFERYRELCRVARAHGLLIHVDGARIFNAVAATGVPAAEWAAEVDTLTFCLSKGLSCPVGSVVVGSRDVIAEVRRARKRVGGAMRQAGVIAAAGIVALETTVERLAEDHANARLLAEGLAAKPGVRIDLSTVETNMVYAEVRGTGMDAATFVARAEAGGVRFLATGPTTVRLVTHRMVSRADAEEAGRVLAAL